MTENQPRTESAPRPQLGLTAPTPAPAPVKVGVVVGSSRPGRKAAEVAQWVQDSAAAQTPGATVGLDVWVLDLAAVGLPLLDEPVPAVFGRYQHEHTRAWAAQVDACDAFVVVTPEYNHSIPAVLKNAVDFLYAEWNHKPVGVVSYGLAGGVRAAEHLRSVLLEVKATPVSTQLALSVFDDFDYTDSTDPTSPFTLTPRDHQAQALAEMLDELAAYARALAGLRDSTGGAA